MRHGSTLAQWQQFWIIPLVFASVVTVLFLFGFREKQGADVSLGAKT